MADASKNPPRMPGDILHFPQGNESGCAFVLASGYTSSNEDHFSDAPEGPNDEGEPISNPSPPATGDLNDDTPESAATSQLPDKSTAAEQDIRPISIPGTFGSDGIEDEAIESATPRLQISATDEQANSVEVRGDVVEAEALGNGVRSVSPDIVVKWNELNDRIQPKVRGERERIERLVQGERGRSRSPSTTSPVSQRKASTSPLSVRRSSTSPVSTRRNIAGQGKADNNTMDMTEVAVTDSNPLNVIDPVMGGTNENPMEAVEDRNGEPSEEFITHCAIELATAEVDTSAPTAPKSLPPPISDEPPPVSDEPPPVSDEPPPVSDEPSKSDGPLASDEPIAKTAPSSDEQASTPKPPTLSGSPTQPSIDDSLKTDDQPRESTDVDSNAKAEDDGFGDDDFNDFGDAVEADGDFNDFDDFEGFQDGDADSGFDGPPSAPVPTPPPQAVIPQLPVPLPDFGDLDGIENSLLGAVEKMFPRKESGQRKQTSIEGRSFLTERSLSLWNQLVAPPPLQPPNWKISRIRRLFLVSLGIPLDLDEILPTETKQKKLVLPSVHLPRHSIDSRPSSRNSRRSGSQSRRKKGEDRNQIKPEALDIPNARILCSTSAVALRNFTEEELQDHVRKLEEITAIASEVLTYWLGKRDGAVSDKETFETVIESLVGYARKKRQNG